MKDKGIRYFNFPIQLLHGFLDDMPAVLKNIISYSLYAHAISLDCHEYDIETAMNVAAKFHKATLGDFQTTYERGMELYDSLPQNSPKCGINTSIYWDFRNNHKSEFEKVVLLAFLSIKSILGNKPYCKITNDFFISRMDGKVKKCDLSEISPAIKTYLTAYRLTKLKDELKLKWYLVTYGKRMRGFYVAFDMLLEDLIYYAEKNRVKNLKKKLKKEEDAALKKALEKINME